MSWGGTLPPQAVGRDWSLATATTAARGRKQGEAVGAAASKTQAIAKRMLGAATRRCSRRKLPDGLPYYTLKDACCSTASGLASKMGPSTLAMNSFTFLQVFFQRCLHRLIIRIPHHHILLRLIDHILWLKVLLPWVIPKFFP